MPNHYLNMSIKGINDEIWKDIIGWEGRYQVSSKGRIKSLMRIKVIGKNGKRMCEQFIMKQNFRRGYLSVLLWRWYDDYEKWQVNRLVALHFIKNPDFKPTVNHKNGIKTDNMVRNLEWATQSEQQIHAVANNLRDNAIGEKSNFCKLSKKIVLEIRKVYLDGAMNVFEISKKYNTAVSNVRYIINRATWKHI